MDLSTTTRTPWKKRMCKFEVYNESDTTNSVKNPPYSVHNSNVAKRHYQTVKESTNCIMNCTGTPVFLWLEVLKYTCYLLNHTFFPSLDAIPFQLSNGKRINKSFHGLHWNTSFSMARGAQIYILFIESYIMSISWCYSTSTIKWFNSWY